MTDARPVTLLIAALGGEGGGVLTDWIVSAAESCGLPVQSTSIPGVAQRTGATTYYVEIFPVPLTELVGRRPVLALAPGVGDVDMVVASELMEAGRAITNGFVTKDRTLLIASTSRVYLTTEKMAMGDGRYDQERLMASAAANSREVVLFDMADLARQNGAIVNAVMLGAIVGSGRLPMPAEAFEAAIKRDGKAVDANLKGFRAGLAIVRDAAPSTPSPLAGEGREAARKPGKRAAKPTLADLEAGVAELPEAARALATEGVRRLAAYQDTSYARGYLKRLGVMAAIDARSNAGGRLVAAFARHLAVRMSYEDVIRVAEAKIAPARLRRIEGEIGAKDQPYVVTEFLKPGIEEMCQVLPPKLAHRIMMYSEKRGWLGKVYFPMEVKTTRLSGYLRFWALAKLKRWRPKSSRFASEQTAIQSWMMQIESAAKRSPDLAIEVVECARLIKGYGDTWQRGRENYAKIIMRVLVPAVRDGIPVSVAIDAIASARTAALVDPEGESLEKALVAIKGQMTGLPLAAE
jgi:indolepyruvate ferredoxin oxidoreductase beta subunit